MAELVGLFFLLAVTWSAGYVLGYNRAMKRALEILERERGLD